MLTGLEVTMMRWVENFSVRTKSCALGCSAPHLSYHGMVDCIAWLTEPIFSPYIEFETVNDPEPNHEGVHIQILHQIS
jgi:hypothetical protein